MQWFLSGSWQNTCQMVLSASNRMRFFTILSNILDNHFCYLTFFASEKPLHSDTVKLFKTSIISRNFYTIYHFSYIQLFNHILCLKKRPIKSAFKNILLPWYPDKDKPACWIHHSWHSHNQYRYNVPSLNHSYHWIPLNSNDNSILSCARQ